MCDTNTGLQATVQSSNLNEELGMVHYIFSDKTGTLTQNVMEFKRFSAGTYEYGSDDPLPFEYPSGVTNVNFEDLKYDEHIQDTSHENNASLKRFFEALGICHTVITDNKVDKEKNPYICYSASSPDELALVNGARHLGFFFRERDADNNMVCDTWDGERKYKLLNLLEFDSTRKRMTVVVRTPENKVLVICKGADSIIEKRLKKG
jgi:phospholipid-transporting ATPase